MPLLNIGWFSTGRDEAARQLLQAVQEEIRNGEIKGRIAFVFSNREPGESRQSDLFFELVRGYGLPLVCLSHRKFRASTQGTEDYRPEYDRQLGERIRGFTPDLCVLAGYMLIVGQALCQNYAMINLHPAPPGGPTGSWQEVIWKLIEGQVGQAGAMMHLVTPDLDRGPVVSYCVFPIKDRPFYRYWQNSDREMLFQLIRRHELAREFPLIIFTLQALGRGEISIRDGRIVDAQGRTTGGYDVSDRVDKAVTDGIASIGSPRRMKKQ